MQPQKRFLHDKVIIILLTILPIVLMVGLSVIFLRFDPGKSQTIISALRPGGYVSGKSIDIYSLAVFMVAVSLLSFALSMRIYKIQRNYAVYMLASAIFLIIMATRVAYSLILKQ